MMIDSKFLQEIGLNCDQIALIMGRMDKISRYRQVLYQEGVIPKCVDKIIRATDPDEVDFSNMALLREKVRHEWSNLIVS